MKATKEAIPPDRQTVKIVLELTADESKSLSWLLWAGHTSNKIPGHRSGKCEELWQQLRQVRITSTSSESD